MEAWKAALAAALATAAIALIVVAPMTAGSKGTKRLKIVTENAIDTAGATAKCPRGYVVIAGGFESREAGGVARSERIDKRRWSVRGAVVPKRRGQLVAAQAICAKGAGGVRVSDLGG